MTKNTMPYIASFTDGEIASRVPVISAEAIAPRSPLSTEWMRSSISLRVASSTLA